VLALRRGGLFGRLALKLAELKGSKKGLAPT